MAKIIIKFRTISLDTNQLLAIKCIFFNSNPNNSLMIVKFKTHKLMTILSILLFLFSCSQNENSTNNNSIRIITLAPHLAELTVEAGELLLEIDNRSEATELKRLQIDLQLAEQRSSRLQALASNRSTSKEALEVARAEAASLRAEIEGKQLELDSHQIKAPFNGVLGNFDWESSSWIEASSLFTTLDDMTELEVQFDLPERFLSALTIGQTVELSSNAWPKQEFEGKVVLIEPRFDADRATLSVEAIVSNDQQKLRPGMRVKVSLVENADALSLLIPVRSLIHDRNQTQVLKLSEDDIPSLQLVTTGRATEKWVEILSGLDTGDRIVDRGVVKARPNRPVNILNKSERGS